MALVSSSVSGLILKSGCLNKTGQKIQMRRFNFGNRQAHVRIFFGKHMEIIFEQVAGSKLGQ